MQGSQIKIHLETYTNEFLESSKSYDTKRSKKSKLKHLIAFIEKYELTEVAQLDMRNVHKLHTYCTYRNLCIVSANKVIEETKQFIRWCIMENIIDNSSALVLRLPNEKLAPIKYLNSSHLEKLNSLKTDNKILRKVADWFLFQCYTGLAYVDLKAFCATKNIQDYEGSKLLVICRSKSDQVATIPLLPVAESIIEKYPDGLKVMTIQRYNFYLKELAGLIGLPFKLTSHIGRKTAATYLLNERIPLKAVAMALGHADSSTTERYYAVLEKQTLISEFDKLIRKAS